MASKVLENQHQKWCSSVVSTCPACRRPWLRSLAPQTRTPIKRQKHLFQRLCNMHSQQNIYRPHSVLLVIPKVHGKKPPTCRIKSCASTVFLKVLTEETVLWLPQVFTCTENNIFGFIKFFALFTCTICVPGVHGLEEVVSLGTGVPDDCEHGY